MVSTLVFSITTAGLVFLVLGERLGLPAPLGLMAMQALLGLACGLILLFSATNRLDPFLGQGSPAHALGRVARIAILLFAAIAASGGLALDEPARIGFLLAGYLAGTLLLLPREAGFHAEGARPLLAGGMLRLLAVAMMALVLVILWLPQVLTALAGALQREASGLRSIIITGLAAGVVLGGALGLSRLARAILLLGLVFAALPFGVAAFLENSWPVEALRGTLATLVRDGPNTLLSGAWRHGLPDLLVGLAIGAFGSALRPAREGAGRTLVFSALAVLVALGGALVVLAEVVRLHGLVISQIADRPPARWPLFVFDEAIQGWVKVCGEAPRDVLDAFRACRARGLAGTFPASEIRLEPSLLGPAIASSHGIPVILGAGWMLAAPVVCLVALALLLHGAAILVSETALYRRAGNKALRSSRLLLARLLALLPLAALLVLPADFGLEDRMALWLMLGAALLILVARFADLLRAGVIAWQSRQPRLPEFTPREATP